MALTWHYNKVILVQLYSHKGGLYNIPSHAACWLTQLLHRTVRTLCLTLCSNS